MPSKLAHRRHPGLSAQDQPVPGAISRASFVRPRLAFGHVHQDTHVFQTTSPDAVENRMAYTMHVFRRTVWKGRLGKCASKSFPARFCFLSDFNEAGLDLLG